MNPFSQFSDFQESDLPIACWDQHALAPRNQNVMTVHLGQPSSKTFNRKQILWEKRKLNRKIMLQETQNICNKAEICEAVRKAKPKTVFRDDRQSSNLSLFKLKMENIDKDCDRWMEDSFGKMESFGSSSLHRKVKSGVIKMHSEQQQRMTNWFERNKGFRRSTQSSRCGSKMRPQSCRNELSQAAGLLNNTKKERAVTIHSKTRVKSFSWAKKGRKLARFQDLTINQLQSSKANEILRCLSLRR